MLHDMFFLLILSPGASHPLLVYRLRRGKKKKKLMMMISYTLIGWDDKMEGKKIGGFLILFGL